MVITSIKSVPGVALLNQIAGTMTNIISGTGITLTKSPQMVIPWISLVVTGLVQTVDTAQLE